MSRFSPLLDPPAFPPDAFAALADRLKRLLGTANDLVFLQGEAILALEAAAASLARPGLVALNVVTSPYGALFGQWLRRGGADVHEVGAEPGRPIAAAAVEAALGALPKVDLLSLVHAETSSGILNPLPAISALAKRRGALIVVDAVASFAGHPLDVDALGIDVCIIGPQKALGGPAGLSMATVSSRAWAAIEAASARVPSSLSLLDLKRNWLDRGRGVLPGMPSALEFWALEAAVSGLEAEGLEARIARHALAARASRAGLMALGTGSWVTDEALASTMATGAPVPAGLDAVGLVAEAARLGVTLTPGHGEIRDRLVRLDHTGARANFSTVLASVVGYGMAVERLGGTVDIAAGAAAVARAYAGRGEP
jgi:aspartate aminotransferase-like enzyme